jgi:hypothetical protein
MLKVPRCPLAFFLAAPLVAQTFVVDAANGPGTNFTDLPPAILAVPDGAILLVRPGTYGRIVLDGKGMSILATAPGVNLAANQLPIYVKNLTAAQAFTLRGIHAQQGATYDIGFLQNCSGPVLIDGFQFTSTQTFDSLYSRALRIETCAQVMLRNCTLRAYAAVYASNSTIVAEQCELHGHDAFYISMMGAYPGMGIECDVSNVTLSRCHVSGGNGLMIPAIFVAPAPAIAAYHSLVRLCEDASGSYTAGQLTSGGPVAAIGVSLSTIVRSPEAVLVGSNGGPAVAAGLTDIVRPLPSLRTISAPPGGIVQVDVTTPVGEIVFVFFGRPSVAPLGIPGFDGTFGLDPGSALLATAGVPQTGVPVVMSLQVPSLPIFVGERYAWQALAWSAPDGFRFSNASTYAH